MFIFYIQLVQDLIQLSYTSHVGLNEYYNTSHYLLLLKINFYKNIYLIQKLMT